ncbi:MAG: hypothetical protein H0X33_02885 [Taibaiella sp.]|nr:hypothetical protein [Taibaiella sp.]
MKRILKTPIGLWNIGVIILLTVLIGFISILFLGSSGDMERIKQHLFSFLIFRHWGLLRLTLSVIGVLLLINIIVDSVMHKKINGRKLLAVLFWGVITTFLISVLGDIILFS